MEYHLQIFGWAWGGFKSCYQYSLSQEQATKLLENQNPKPLVGDFESVLDWRLVRETNTYEHVARGLDRRIDEFKTLRGFRNGMKPSKFHRLINGYSA